MVHGKAMKHMKVMKHTTKKQKPNQGSVEMTQSGRVTTV